jgi:hypothetical protein
VAGYSLRKQLIQKFFTLALFFQIIRGSLLDESLQVIGVLLHARQQVVQDVAALVVTARKQVNASVQPDTNSVYPPLYCSLYGPAYVVRWNKLAQ